MLLPVLFHYVDSLKQNFQTDNQLNNTVVFCNKIVKTYKKAFQPEVYLYMLVPIVQKDELLLNIFLHHTSLLPFQILPQHLHFSIPFGNHYKNKKGQQQLIEILFFSFSYFYYDFLDNYAKAKSHRSSGGKFSY
ncbi:hypothetical protein D3C87_1589040 [compost metagenome]